MNELLEELAKTNDARLQALAQRGVQVNGLDALWATRLLEALARQLLPEEAFERVRMEQQQQVAQTLDQVEQQIARQQIVKPGLFRK